MFRTTVQAEIKTNKQTKTCLLPGSKTMTKLDNVLKSRDISLLTKGHVKYKALFFPVVMYGYGVGL